MSSEEVTLSDLWNAIRARAMFILGLSLALAASGLGMSFIIKPVFTANVLLSPVADEAGSAGGGGSQLASIASLAGFSLGGSNFQQEAIATLQSRTLIDQFIQDHQLLPELFPSLWDAEANRWKSDDPDEIPTLWDGSRLFVKKILNISTDKKSGLLTLSISWKDPRIAADWANEITSRANGYLSRKAVLRSQKNIEFLQNQLEKTLVVDIRQSIFRIIEAQLKALTLAQGSQEYAFKVIDVAVAPHRRSSPEPVLFALGGASMGLLLGIAIALLRAGRPSGTDNEAKF